MRKCRGLGFTCQGPWRDGYSLHSVPGLLTVAGTLARVLSQALGITVNREETKVPGRLANSASEILCLVRHPLLNVQKIFLAT